MIPSRKRSVLLAVSIVVAAVLAFLVIGGPGGVDSPDGTRQAAWQQPGYTNSGVPGDVDGDGKISDDEQADLDTAEATVRDVVLGTGTGTGSDSGLAPTKGVDTVIVTPAGAQWWAFLTNMATDLALWDAPAPAGVDWFALTQGRSYTPDSERLVRYSALHLTFPTAADAERWLLANSQSGASANVYQTVRGRVLTITPSWVQVAQEPYGPVDELAASRAQVKVGLWQVDYAEEFKNEMREVTDPQAYQAMWEALGFGAATSWVATSPTPDADWVGRLSGFDAARVDGYGVVAAVNTSVFYCQNGEHDCRGEVGGGISEAINEIYVVDGKGHGGGDETLMPSTGHADAALTFTYSGAFRGMVNETMARNSGSIERFDTWVSKDGMLSVRPVFRQVGEVAADDVDD